MVAMSLLLVSLPATRSTQEAATQRSTVRLCRRDNTTTPMSDADVASALQLPITDVDIWGRLPMGPVVMLPASVVRRLTQGFSPLRACEVLIKDVGALVASQAATHRPQYRAPNASVAFHRRAGRRELPEFFDDYRDLASVHAYLELLALEHPEQARFIPSIGPSYEGRPIPGIAIGGVAGGPAVYIQATSHSREWISTSTAMAMVFNLLESGDPALRSLVARLRFFIVPVLNPDGYVYTFTEQGRMWRKTMSPNAGSTCIGTDLNRNYDDHWGGEGLPVPLPQCASTDPCSNSYRGAEVWSEPEAAAARDFLAGPARAENELVGLLDLHSFGQMFNRPYGWVDPAALVPPNEDATRACGEAMLEAIAATTGQAYINQHGFELYYLRVTLGTNRTLDRTLVWLRFPMRKSDLWIV
jgi:hypothetical protein